MHEQYQLVPLGELAELRMGATPSRIEPSYWADGQSGELWVSIRDIQGKFITRTSETITFDGVRAARLRRVEPGTPIMSFKLSLGRATIPAVPVFTNEAIVALKARTDKSQARWLYHVVPVIAKNAVAETAIKGKTLNLEKLKRLPIPTPGTLVEQRRIAEILDAVDEQILNSRNRLSKIESVERGHRLAAFSDCQYGRVSDEKTWIRVSEVGEIKLGRQRSPRYATGDYMAPYLRVANVFDGDIDYSDVLSMNFSPLERRAFELRQGDILLNEGQSLELVGRCAIYDGPEGMFFQNTLIRFRPQRVSPEYARAVFKYWLDVGKFASVGKQTTSIAHLGVDRFAAMNFPLMAEPEQERVVEGLRNIEDLKRQVSSEIVKLRAVKEALMNDLLAGRVRVPIGAEG